MKQFTDNLRKFMYGRYGVDQLSRGLIVLALILTLISSVSGYFTLSLISYIPILLAFFRILSRNISQRSKENMIYTQMTGTAKTKLRNIRWVLFGTKTHKYYSCSKCRQLIRIPRGKGRICITCPKCKQEFTKRT